MTIVETLKIVLKTAEYGMTSKEAYDEIIRRKLYTFAEQQQQKNLKLIDGEMLNALMIKYEVGITTEDSIKIYRVDSSYFE